MNIGAFRNLEDRVLDPHGSYYRPIAAGELMKVVSFASAATMLGVSLGFSSSYFVKAVGLLFLACPGMFFLTFWLSDYYSLKHCKRFDVTLLEVKPDWDSLARPASVRQRVLELEALTRESTATRMFFRWELGADVLPDLSPGRELTIYVRWSDSAYEVQFAEVGEWTTDPFLIDLIPAPEVFPELELVAMRANG